MIRFRYLLILQLSCTSIAAVQADENDITLEVNNTLYSEGSNISAEAQQEMLVKVTLNTANVTSFKHRIAPRLKLRWDKIDTIQMDGSICEAVGNKWSISAIDCTNPPQGMVISYTGNMSKEVKKSKTYTRIEYADGNKYVQKQYFMPNNPLPELTEGAMPNHTGIMLQEHMAALALVDYSNVTHAAILNGNWNNPNTWHNGEVPTNNANVVIPENIDVLYDLVSDTRLHTVRVDGKLSFDPDNNTKIIFDTLFVDPRGTLEMGSSATPINAQADMLIASNGDIDISWDSMLQSRGIIAHGKTSIHGQAKTTHLKVATDPRAGDTLLTLASAPQNWQEGDRIIVSGTFYSGYKWDNTQRKHVFIESQDEVRTITSINGNVVTLNEALKHDHVTPRADLKASIANTSRNITIASENGASLPVHQRGHVMFMHSNNVDVRYAAFDHLGRTDKSVDSFNIETVENLQTDSNIRGRYSFHFHRTGTADQKNPAIAIGNSVFNSPGWGYVHHDAHANFFDNVSYDTFGAGFVAEVGNETGTWARNIAIKGQGQASMNPKNSANAKTFDTARGGSGFWFQGRLVRAIDNIASSFTHGFVYYHRGQEMLSFSPDLFMLPEALQYGGLVRPDDIPIRNFDNNEAYAITVGLAVVKANPNQGHDVTTILSNFTGWEVEIGVLVDYTSHYLMDNLDLIGNTPEKYRSPRLGVSFGKRISDMVVRNARIDGFDDGILLSKALPRGERSTNAQYVVIEPTFLNIKGDHYVDFDPAQDTLIDNSQLKPNQFTINLNGAPDFEYLPTVGDGIDFTGTKQDSIGSTSIPAGTDRFWISSADIRALVKQEGYYRTAEGIPYVLIESYFSDRATGDIHKSVQKIKLSSDIDAAMQRSRGAWAGAFNRGLIDFNNQAPIANDDIATVSVNSTTIIDLKQNDTDPEGDNLLIDGILAPRNASVYDNGDGTITYIPDFQFTGTDTFYYWISDNQGHFSKAHITVTVQ